MTPATATVPASQAATLRAWDGRNAAQRLPVKGRITIQINDMNYRYDLLRTSSTRADRNFPKKDTRVRPARNLWAHTLQGLSGSSQGEIGWIGHRQHSHAQGENC